MAGPNSRPIFELWDGTHPAEAYWRWAKGQRRIGSDGPSMSSSRLRDLQRLPCIDVLTGLLGLRGSCRQGVVTLL